MTEDEMRELLEDADEQREEYERQRHLTPTEGRCDVCRQFAERLGFLHGYEAPLCPGCIERVRRKPMGMPIDEERRIELGNDHVAVFSLTVEWFPRRRLLHAKLVIADHDGWVGNELPPFDPEGRSDEALAERISVLLPFA